MPYAVAVASVAAKGATMSGYRFRLFCLAGLLGTMLGAQPGAGGSSRPQRSLARPGPGHLQQSSDERRRRRHRHRDAVPRRGCGDRAGDAAHQACGRRQPPRAADHARDRPEPRAAGGEVRTGTGRQSVGNLDARAHQQLYRRSCGGRAERRQALHGKDLCEGLRRLLRARRQERRRRQEPTGPDAIPAIRAAPARVPPAAPARPRS